MPALQKLLISKLRNIHSAEIKPASKLNIFYGDNGSGKSSILEAIYLLGMARSFRSNLQKPLIQHNEKECTVFGELANGETLGLSKVSGGAQQLRISGRKAENTAELAKCLPMQLLNSDTFKILEGSPKIRRHYLDWGVFHVEHRFIDQWRQAQRSLKNRNNLLKRNATHDEIEPWTQEFIKHAQEIDKFRTSYVESLLPVLSEVLDQLLPLDKLSLEYERGWEQGADLQAIMRDGFTRDLRYGYTVSGPQRADIKIKIGSHYAVDILSRGQQKLLVSALRAAQGLLVEREVGKQCVYLVDDLSSELDKNNRKKICQLLSNLNCQIFITSVEKSALEDCWDNTEFEGEERKLFHVKHGKIKEESLAK